MNQAIEVTSRLFDLLTQNIVGVEIENIGHKIKSILVVRDLGVQTREVEPISQVVLINFAKVFVATG
jgi:hypothetical protein